VEPRGVIDRVPECQCGHDANTGYAHEPLRGFVGPGFRADLLVENGLLLVDLLVDGQWAVDGRA